MTRLPTPACYRLAYINHLVSAPRLALGTCTSSFTVHLLALMVPNNCTILTVGSLMTCLDEYTLYFVGTVSPRRRFRYVFAFREASRLDALSARRAHFASHARPLQICLAMLRPCSSCDSMVESLSEPRDSKRSDGQKPAVEARPMDVTWTWRLENALFAGVITSATPAQLNQACQPTWSTETRWRKVKWDRRGQRWMGEMKAARACRLPFASFA